MRFFWTQVAPFIEFVFEFLFASFCWTSRLSELSIWNKIRRELCSSAKQKWIYFLFSSISLVLMQVAPMKLNLYNPKNIFFLFSSFDVFFFSDFSHLWNIIWFPLWHEYSICIKCYKKDIDSDGAEIRILNDFSRSQFS